MGRYRLIIKQCVQLELYTEDDGTIKDRYNADNGYSAPQTIMTMFSSDDQTKIGETAKQLRSLQSTTHILIYDTNTGARITVK